MCAVLLPIILLFSGCDQDTLPTTGSEVIDSEGGEVTASDGKGHTATLVFPSYAIAGQQTITLSFTGTNDDAFGQALTTRIHIEPAGLILLEEATLMITSDDESKLQQGSILYSINDSSFRPPVDDMEVSDGTISGGIYLLEDAAVALPTLQEVSTQVGLAGGASSSMSEKRAIQQANGGTSCIPVDYGWQETSRDVGGLLQYAEEAQFFGDSEAASAASNKANEVLNERINEFLNMTPSGDQCAQYAVAAERYVSAGMRLGILDENHPLYQKYYNTVDQCAIRFSIEFDIDDGDGVTIKGTVQCHASYWEFLTGGTLSNPVGTGILTEHNNKEWTDPDDDHHTINGNGTITLQAKGMFDYSVTEQGQGTIYLELDMTGTRTFSGEGCSSKHGCIDLSDTSLVGYEFKGPFTSGYKYGTEDEDEKYLLTLHIINFPTRPGFDDLYCQ